MAIYLGLIRYVHLAAHIINTWTSGYLHKKIKSIESQTYKAPLGLVMQDSSSIAHYECPDSRISMQFSRTTLVELGVHEVLHGPGSKSRL